MNGSDHYLVDVIGFNEVERSMLTSIFALAARRDPGFGQYEPGAQGRAPDLYLVDADDITAFNQFKALHKRAQLPAVLIGSNSGGTPHAVLPRPLQWAKLLQALEFGRQRAALRHLQRHGRAPLEVVREPHGGVAALPEHALVAVTRRHGEASARASSSSVADAKRRWGSLAIMRSTSGW